MMFELIIARNISITISNLLTLESWEKLVKSRKTLTLIQTYTCARKPVDRKYFDLKYILPNAMASESLDNLTILQFDMIH